MSTEAYSDKQGFQAIFPGTNQTIVTSGSSQQSSAFASLTSIIRVYCTQDCYLAFGTDPTASSSSLFLPSGTIEYFGVYGGTKVAVLQVSASGNLYITEGK